jgi:hypothetical protein
MLTLLVDLLLLRCSLFHLLQQVLTLLDKAVPFVHQLLHLIHYLRTHQRFTFMRPPRKPSQFLHLFMARCKLLLARAYFLKC